MTYLQVLAIGRSRQPYLVLDNKLYPDYIGTRIRGVLRRFKRSICTIPDTWNGGQATLALNITPLHDRVVVKRIEEKESVKGGIIIPDTAKEKPQEGEVIAVGNGKVLENGTKVPLDVKAGDKILFGKYSGTDIKIDGQEYLILREDEVLAVVG